MLNKPPQKPYIPRACVMSHLRHVADVEPCQKPAKDTGDYMSSFRDPDIQERRSSAAAARKAMLEKYRAASEDPAVAERHAARVAVNEARLARLAEREAAKKVREAELAAE